MDYLPAIETESPAGVPVEAAVIWLHGLGASGDDFAPIVPELKPPPDCGVRFIFPHAPAMPVTINNGMVMPAWYDIKGLDSKGHADIAQLRGSAGRVRDLIKREMERGVAPERIVVAGFSQGGAVALEAGLGFPRRLAGIMVLSSYLATADSIKVEEAQRGIPVLLCHGSADPMVPETLGRKTEAALQGLGFAPAYHSYPMPHAVCPEEIQDIAAWLRQVLAPSAS